MDNLKQHTVKELQEKGDDELKALNDWAWKEYKKIKLVQELREVVLNDNNKR